MTRVLEAWLEGIYVGQFREDARSVTFVYDRDAPQTPISLSLPRNAAATRNAAAHYLENLLPDVERARQWMKRVTGAASVGSFDLLEKVGGDIAGGLILLPDGEPVPARAQVLDPATEDQIAERIHTLKRDSDMWLEPDGRARFSMAGSQAKFALAAIDGDWYWSNASLPSTHILKPGNPKTPGVEHLEAASLALARAAGIDAADGSIVSTLDESTYIVSRFDRIDGKRIHAEDFAQAGGTKSDLKYGVMARQAVAMLHTAGALDDLGYRFVSQLAFNTMLGNADAHAKNYSLLIRPSGISLAPLYDSLPTIAWPEYDKKLAMKIGGAQFAPQVSLEHWRKFAGVSGLDPDRVTAQVSRIALSMGENLDLLRGGIDLEQFNAVEAAIMRNVDKVVARAPQ